MAAVELTHQSLLDDVRSAPDTGCSFWWLGQHSFIVKIQGHVVYIDPFFAPWESRHTPPLLLPEEAELANLVLVTHGHGDHLCPESLAGMVTASPGATFVCPCTERERLTDEAHVPDAQIHCLTAYESLEYGALKVTAIRAKHETFDEHPEKGFPFLGYVVECGGCVLYHAGDTIMYDGLRADLAKWAPFNVMFLPINGRDAQRYLSGCIGNFTFQEAVELAGEVGTRLAVPTHYDMFTGNQEDPDKFVSYLGAKYPGTPSWVGPAGKRVTLSE